jgi:hypothetical protein
MLVKLDHEGVSIFFFTLEEVTKHHPGSHSPSPDLNTLNMALKHYLELVDDTEPAKRGRAHVGIDNDNMDGPPNWFHAPGVVDVDDYDQPVQHDAEDLRLTAEELVHLVDKKFHRFIALNQQDAGDIPQIRMFLARVKASWYPFSVQQKDTAQARQGCQAYQDREKYVTSPSFSTARRMLVSKQVIPVAINSLKADGSSSYSFATLTLEQLVLASYMLHRDDMRFCSMTLPGRPVHLYVDLDCKVAHEPLAQRMMDDFHTTVMLFIQHMKDYYLEVMGTQLNDSVLQISPTRDASKFSVHINMPTQCYVDVNHLGSMMAGLTQWIKAKRPNSLFAQVKSLGSLIDLNVYRPWNNMKMVGSKKPGRSSMVLYDHMGQEDFDMSQIAPHGRFMCLFNELTSYSIMSEPVAWPLYVEREKKIKQRQANGEKMVRTECGGALKETYFGFTLNAIQAACAQYDFELVDERHVSHEGAKYVSFTTRNTACPRRCHDGETHKTWWAQCYVTAKEVTMTCPAQSCKGKKTVLLTAPLTLAQIGLTADDVEKAFHKKKMVATIVNDNSIALTSMTSGLKLVEHREMIVTIEQEGVYLNHDDKKTLIIKAKRDKIYVEPMREDVVSALVTKLEEWIATPQIPAYTVLHHLVNEVAETMPEVDPYKYFPTLVPSLNKLWVWIEGSNGVVVRTPINGKVAWVLHDKRSFEENYCHCSIGHYNIAVMWLHCKDRKMKTRMTHLPSLILEKNKDTEAFNVWEGFDADNYPPVNLNYLKVDQYQAQLRLDPRPEDEPQCLEEKVAYFLDLMHDVCGGASKDPDMEGFRFYADHTSYMLKYPGRKTGVYINFYSRTQGNGKSTMGVMIRKMMGEATSFVVGKKVEERLFGTYNGHMVGMTFIDIDEGGDNPAIRRNLNDFKNMITDPVMVVREMHKNHRANVPAYEHYQSTSNKPPVHQTGDRRNVIYKSGEKYKGTVLFARLYEWFKDTTFIRAMYQWFINRQVQADWNMQDRRPVNLDSMRDMDVRQAPLEIDFFIEAFINQPVVEGRHLDARIRTATALAEEYTKFVIGRIAGNELTKVSAKRLHQSVKDLGLLENGTGLEHKKRVRDGVMIWCINVVMLRTWLIEKRFFLEEVA